jgi:NTE family protein
MSEPSPKDKKPVTLALQGGGSHGAFTWGVLDRLLEEPSLDIKAISGTSAGAINGAALVHGMAEGDSEAAKKALHDFWHSVSQAGESALNPCRHLPDLLGLRDIATAWGGALSHFWSPYDNPSYANALEPLIANIDFARLRRCDKPKLFVCATNVRTNERKIFEGEELSVRAILASACLPQFFQAVDVNGEFYWDGGYVGNPVLTPLLDFCQDMLLVEVNPVRRNEVPKRAEDIINRLNEITFNSALVREINLLTALNRLIEEGRLINTGLKPVRLHSISAEDEMSALGAATKTNTDWGFLCKLRELGRNAAGTWVDDPEKFGKVGVCATMKTDTKLLLSRQDAKFSLSHRIMSMLNRIKSPAEEK